MTAPRGGAERIARSAALKVLVQATRFASLVLVIVMARVLGPAEFGKFTFGYALATILGIALDFGISLVLTRAVARDPSVTADRWGTAVTLKLALLGLLGPVYLAVPLLMHRPWDTTLTVWLLGLAITLQAFLENAVSVFTAVQRLEHELQMRLVEKGVLAIAGFTALGLGAGLLGVAAAFALAAAVSLAFATWRIHRRVAPLGRWWRPAGARRLARELAPVAQAQILGAATSRLAPVALALLAGDQAVGHFGAAFRVYDVAWVVLTSLEAAVYPELARTPARHPRVRTLTSQACEALLLVALPIALGLGAGASWLTPWIYGPGYGPTASVLAVLGTAATCAMLGHLLGIVLLALDRPRRLRAVAAVAFVTGLLAIPSLAAVAGALGAAVGVLIVEVVILGAGLLSVRGLAGWPLGRGAAKGLAAAAAGAIVASLVPAGPWRFAGALVAYGVALAVLKPAPGAVYLRLLRGALGRPGPPSAAGVR
ncbi:MAG TPA: oligosaccharide flippase family protein [Methylomirabilota bacterium]|jgi:O-antigen/teichoic acid export membrane protein